MAGIAALEGLARPLLAAALFPLLWTTSAVISCYLAGVRVEHVVASLVDGIVLLQDRKATLVLLVSTTVCGLVLPGLLSHRSLMFFASVYAWTLLVSRADAFAVSRVLVWLLCVLAEASGRPGIDHSPWAAHIAAISAAGPFARAILGGLNRLEEHHKKPTDQSDMSSAAIHRQRAFRSKSASSLQPLTTVEEGALSQSDSPTSTTTTSALAVAVAVDATVTTVKQRPVHSVSALEGRQRKVHAAPASASTDSSGYSSVRGSEEDAASDRERKNSWPRRLSQSKPGPRRASSANRDEGSNSIAFKLSQRVDELRQDLKNARMQLDERDEALLKLREEHALLQQACTRALSERDALAETCSQLKKEVANVKIILAESQTSQRRAEELTEQKRALEAENSRLRHSLRAETRVKLELMRELNRLQSL